MTTHMTNRRESQSREQQDSIHAATATERERIDQATPPRPIASAPSQILKVSAGSPPAALAGAIANVIRTSGVAEIQAIGAGATNQAVKAIAIARTYLTGDSISIYFTPSFVDLLIDGAERTGLRLLVERR